MDGNNTRQISKAIVKRLPRYLRYLRELLEQGRTRISSEELSKMMKTTASQIRQDLNHFGGFGQQGYGYNVEILYREICKILGTEEAHRLIIIGAGNLGRALVKYKGFTDHGFKFVSLFDVDPELCGKSVSGVRIRRMDQLDEFVQSQKVDIAVMSVPRQSARKIASSVYAMGVRSFWNFSHTDLHLPDDAIVENVHLLDSLLELSFSIKSRGMPHK